MSNRQYPWWRWGGLLLACALAAGCQQQMAKQPAYRPLQQSNFFEDGRASRPLVEGTVARGQLRADTHFFHGTKPGPVDPKAAYGSQFVDTFPNPVSDASLKNGKVQFEVFCAVCHSRVGDGNGMIPQRGFTKPPSFITDLARGYKLRGIDLPLPDAPVGYYFHVATNGYGAMPSYASQIPRGDRWDIIAYIRVLQYSQGAKFAEVKGGGGQP
jgi:mono/diheme cytochrome c family protein